MSKAFFDSLRAAMGPLSQNQVDGMNHLLQATDGLPLRHRAYVLATVHHETGPASSPLHWTPRREIWGNTAAQRNYEGNVALGNTHMGDGKRYMGRGYVQLTGRRNYEKAGLALGKDLVSDPDLALNPDIAARIIVSGMRDGWFTGKKLADFQSYRDMRRVVNGTDRADLIAGYAETFEKALTDSQASPVAPVSPPAAPTVVPTSDSPPAATPDAPRASLQTVMAAIAGLIAAAVAAILALHH